MNLNKDKVRKKLGKPDKILTSPYEEDISSYYLYDKKYGTLAIAFEGSFCKKLFVSAEKRKMLWFVGK